ncbi:MAG TPA: response regulator transcription factor [Glaciibacter sp.]|nr:response regulator transcription factor [Glaciibacter sp.]
MKILIVEDDDQIGDIIERGLATEGYGIVRVTNGIDALTAVAGDDFGMAAVDVTLPSMSGFELCRRMRQIGSTAPVLLLSSRNTVEERVFALGCGADDYLAKPFAFPELKARIRALVRRQPLGTQLSIELGQLVLDFRELKVTVAGRSVPVSPKEFSLLRLLTSRAGSTVDRTTILEEIWNGTHHIDPNIVDQYISYLRRKIDSEAAGVRIVTVRGSGYLAELVD